MSELQIIEYDGKRVLTTQQLADVYETETNNIVKNFSRNESRFVEGRDYHLLQGEELKLFKSNMTNSHFASNLNKLYLWTDRGANRHCKILDTDKAWEQFDVLEENYYQTRANLVKYKQLSQQLTKTIDQRVYNIINDKTKTIEQAESEIDNILQGVKRISFINAMTVTRATNNKLSDFVNDLCDLQEDGCTDLTLLYGAYFTWCSYNDKKTLSKSNFAAVIAEDDDIAYLKADSRRGLNARFMGIKIKKHFNNM